MVQKYKRMKSSFQTMKILTLKNYQLYSITVTAVEVLITYNKTSYSTGMTMQDTSHYKQYYNPPTLLLVLYS